VDYNAFFGDVLAWIGQTNQAAVQHGLGSEGFWQWVADSTGALCKKYDDNRLAIKQMVMMVEWLEEVCENRTRG
jgi:hypothetical protein